MPLLRVRQADWPPPQGALLKVGLEDPWLVICRIFRDGPPFGGSPGNYAHALHQGTYDVVRRKPYPKHRLIDHWSDYWDGLGEKYHLRQAIPNFPHWVHLRQRPSTGSASWAANTYAHACREPYGRPRWRIQTFFRGLLLVTFAGIILAPLILVANSVRVRDHIADLSGD